MRIRPLSDLHLEFAHFELPVIEHEAETVLVLAGDIGNLAQSGPRQNVVDFLRKVAVRHAAVVYVAGNHEFYDGFWPYALQSFRQSVSLPDNVHVLERQAVRLTVAGDTALFAGATLWTDFFGEDPRIMHVVEHALADYRFIGVLEATEMERGQPYDFARRLTARDTLYDHRESRRWIYTTLTDAKREGEQAVLVTHHGVARGSIAPRYANDEITGGFVSDLGDLLGVTRPALCIHGHVHDSFDYGVRTPAGDKATRVVTNPRGYPLQGSGQENPAFNPRLVLTI